KYEVLHDGSEVKLGTVTLTAHHTPGHTPGCTTWTMKVEDGGRTYDVLIIGSVGVNPGTNPSAIPNFSLSISKVSSSCAARMSTCLSDRIPRCTTWVRNMRRSRPADPTHSLIQPDTVPN